MVKLSTPSFKIVKIFADETLFRRPDIKWSMTMGNFPPFRRC
ncbi:unnamed protein product, partial [Larinioides sclopetarius]